MVEVLGGAVGVLLFGLERRLAFFATCHCFTGHLASGFCIGAAGLGVMFGLYWCFDLKKVTAFRAVSVAYRKIAEDCYHPIKST